MLNRDSGTKSLRCAKLAIAELEAAKLFHRQSPSTDELPPTAIVLGAGSAAGAAHALVPGGSAAQVRRPAPALKASDNHRHDSAKGAGTQLDDAVPRLHALGRAPPQQALASGLDDDSSSAWRLAPTAAAATQPRRAPPAPPATAGAHEQRAAMADDASTARVPAALRRVVP